MKSRHSDNGYISTHILTGHHHGSLNTHAHRATGKFHCWASKASFSGTNIHSSALELALFDERKRILFGWLFFKHAADFTKNIMVTKLKLRTNVERTHCGAYPAR